MNSLNNLVGNNGNHQERLSGEKNKEVVIPEEPKGSKMEIYLMSNWGDS
jgi:hypothetical protein